MIDPSRILKYRVEGDENSALGIDVPKTELLPSVYPEEEKFIHTHRSRTIDILFIAAATTLAL